jgi:asparagine synthase (glutamine-hydrolysing)
MTMANSLEMRVPYLDIDMVKFLESLPSSFKINGLQQKYIHKRAAEKLLPHSIIKRKKRGFDTPWDDWLRKVLSERIKILLFDKNSACRLYFDENYIKNMINEHAAGRFNYGKHIFLLFIFELWHKHFIENNYDISKIESIIS